MSGETSRHAGVDPAQRDPALVQPNDNVSERAPVGIGGGRLEALGAQGLHERFFENMVLLLLSQSGTVRRT